MSGAQIIAIFSGTAPHFRQVRSGRAWVIRAFAGDRHVMIPNGNSIFIFEVAGLCIGHLGHLHHPLDESHIAAIGRLDIVMVPIDGTYTMSIEGIATIVRRLRSSIVLPMHRFGTPLSDLLDRLHGQFAIDQRLEPSFRISVGALPRTPTVIVLSGV